MSDHATVQRIFDQVIDAAPADRPSLLDELCAGDVQLKADVESLLRADESAGAFMKSSVADALTQAADLAGSRFGAYALDELIGEGGMGVVYRAHRADDAYEQEVVVKLIRDQTMSRELQARFRRERQVLALLRHANIARLLDGGVERGQPFLVMELVRGEDILTHCDERKLDLGARLDLFDAVCAGVQHAHANLVVHRDLKPAHIIIDEEGAPKLLDFGIASMLDESGVDVTATVQRRLTPQYASPEQVQGAPVTTATDVYALGLILYELLCGRRPYDVGTGTSDADRRFICDTMPVMPSRRLEADADEMSAARRLTPARLRKRLAGDLDTIVMTALRKEPERRYASVEALREDVRRYREGLPIAARPDTWGYRAGKFVARHKVPVGAAVVVALILLGATAVTSRQAGIAAEQRRATARALQTSDTVGRFLRSILVAANPREAGQDVTMLDALGQATARIEAELGDEPEVEARVREAIGETYRSLGVLDAADEHLTRAHELAPAVFVDDEETARLEHELAILRLDQGRFAEARDLARRAHALRAARLGARDDQTLESRNILTLVAIREGRLDEALELALEVAAAREATLGGEHAQTLIAKNTLGEVYNARAEYEQQAAITREVYDAQVRTLGEHHPDTLISANDLGAALTRLDRVDEGLQWHLLALEGLQEHFPAGSLDVVIPRINIAGALFRVERYEQARAQLALAVQDGAPALGEDHYVVGVARSMHGQALRNLGASDDARAELERALEVLTEALGPEHAYTIRTVQELEKLDAGG